MTDFNVRMRGARGGEILSDLNENRHIVNVLSVVRIVEMLNPAGSHNFGCNVIFSLAADNESLSAIGSSLIIAPSKEYPK